MQKGKGHKGEQGQSTEKCRGKREIHLASNSTRLFVSQYFSQKPGSRGTMFARAEQ